MSTKATPAIDVATPTTVTHWQLPIHLEKGQHAVPQIPWDPRIQVGDFVSFSSPDGVPRVVFEGTNPFSKEPGYIIPDSGAQEVKIIPTKDDPAQAYCWIRLRGTEQYIGYGPNSPKTMSGYTVPHPPGG